MRHPNLLSADNCTLLVVDIQDVFVGHIHEMDRVIERSRVMIQAAHLLQLPIIVTQQYPKGLGQTVQSLRDILGDCQYHDKITFSCCQDQGIHDAIIATGRQQILLVGIETHVCISQAACDLLAMDLQPYIATDAVSSRNPNDSATALSRLANLGVTLTTTEAAIMEMTLSSKHPAFGDISKLIK